MTKSVALITVNPTIDIFFQGEDFSFSKKIFAKHSSIASGGSAINVARGLQRLEQSFKLYTVIGGDIGRLVRKQLAEEGIPFCFSENENDTRIAAILMIGGKKRMFVTPSPGIEFTKLRKFIYDNYSEIVNHDLVLIGGSVPEKSSECIARNLVRPLIKRGTRVIVDSRGAFARRVYKEVPYVIKYNKEKLLTPTQGTQKVSQCISVACDLHKVGTSLVIHSTHKHCYAIHDNHIWRYPNFTQFAKHTYGRGDAFLAGLIKALLEEYNFGEAVQFAIACGASFTYDFPLGEISTQLIPNYLKKIKYDVEQGIV